MSEDIFIEELIKRCKGFFDRRNQTWKCTDKHIIIDDCVSDYTIKYQIGNYTFITSKACVGYFHILDNRKRVDN